MKMFLVLVLAWTASAIAGQASVDAFFQSSEPCYFVSAEAHPINSMRTRRGGDN